MKKMFLAIICSMGTLIAYATNNDSGTDEDFGIKDHFYYSGNDKIKLNLDPTKVVVFDFNNKNDLEPSKQNVTRKHPELSFANHFDGSDIMVNVYSVNNLSEKYLTLLSDVKILPFYVDDTGCEIAPDGIIYVALKKEEDFPILLQCAKQFHCSYTHRNQFDNLWCILKITKETTLSPITIANQLYETGMFEAVSPGFFVMNPHEISYDPHVLDQWALYNSNYSGIDISISEAWGYSTGRGIKIAIIDSSFDMNHNDLKDNMSPLSYDASFKKSPCTFNDKNDIHGTHCIGIISAARNNNLDICGVAPDANVIPVRVDFKSDKVAEQIADAINWSRDNYSDIILCAWKCSPNPLIKSAINNALKQGRNGKGCIIIKSAGNEGDKTGEITFPGNYNHDVICVGAITNWGSRVSTSSYGDYMFVCAPGYDILSTVPGNKTEKASGTSTAAPHVAGVAALILSRNPDLTMKQVREIIESNTNDISTEKQTQKEFGMWDPKYGYGLIDAAKCVKATPRKE